jgi:hypothetical protein
MDYALGIDPADRLGRSCCTLSSVLPVVVCAAAPRR